MSLKSQTPNARRRTTSRTAHAARPSAGAQRRAARRGLTLIELLVSIIILVTLIAAVLPAISPNNESRKIREAARQLTSLFAQAQSQAARDGRPVGVGIYDADGHGVALEAYIVAEPPAFTGFSDSSAVLVDQRDLGSPNHNPPVTSAAPPNVFNITFGENVGGEAFRWDRDDLTQTLPGDTFHVGDVVVVGQERFEILENDLDDVDDADSEPDVVNRDTQFPTRQLLKPQHVVAVRWITNLDKNRPPELLPHGGRAYNIRRRPTVGPLPSRTNAQSIQFPKGVGVDFVPTDGNVSLCVVFAPSGLVDAIYWDGNKLPDRKYSYILLGRAENGVQPQIVSGLSDDDFYAPYVFTGSESDDAVAQKRRELNLLNADSRWIVITPEGRILGTQNYVFDPRLKGYVTGDGSDTTAKAQFDRQRDDGYTDTTTTPETKYLPAKFYAKPDQLKGETGG